MHTDTALRAHHPWLVKSHQVGHVPPSPENRRSASRQDHRPPTAPQSARAELIEPLTAKELEVLAHLNRLLDTEEIAEEMVVSVNTVRTHVRHVLRKLGVDRRNAAVRRAWELGMLPGPDAR
jgi:LuxR family transcriptional regulator, maltose regulon positive regulatory protein